MVVIPSVVQARILERELIKRNYTFWWFFSNSNGERLGGARLDTNFYPHRDRMYSILTQGIDKKHNLVLLFTDEYETEFELVIGARNKERKTDLHTILAELGIL